MVDPARQKLTDLLVKEIDESKLTSDEKMSLSSGLTSSLEATNGLTQEEKLQAVSVNCFWLSATVARLYLLFRKAKPPMGWKDVIVECKWQLTILGLGFFFLLKYHPELSGVLTGLAKIVAN